MPSPTPSPTPRDEARDEKFISSAITIMVDHYIQQETDKRAMGRSSPTMHPLEAHVKQFHMSISSNSAFKERIQKIEPTPAEMKATLCAYHNVSNNPKTAELSARLHQMACSGSRESEISLRTGIQELTNIFETELVKCLRLPSRPQSPDLLFFSEGLEEAPDCFADYGCPIS